MPELPSLATFSIDKLVFRKTGVPTKQMIDVQTRLSILFFQPLAPVFIGSYRGNKFAVYLALSLFINSETFLFNEKRLKININ